MARRVIVTPGTEWTQEGVLRHPVYLGLRTDVAPLSVRREGTGTETIASSSGSPAITPTYYALACAETASAPLTYAAIVDAGTGRLWLRRKTSPTSSWTGSSSALRTDAATNVAPAIFAGGSNVFIVYRNSSGRLVIGESTDQGASFTAWSELEVEVSR